MKSKPFSSRIKSFQDKLAINGCDACIIENPLDLFYLTGLTLSSGVLLVDKKNALLCVDGRYIQKASESSPVPTCLTSKESTAAFFKKKGLKRVGFDSQYTSYDNFLSLQKKVEKKVLVPLPSLLAKMRLIKEKEEVAALKKSAELLWKGFCYLQKKIKEGVSEKELALAFELYCLKKGAQKMAFEPIIAFGANSAMPHYRAGETLLKKGDIILIDIGVVVNSYHSDMTRMLFFGNVNPLLKEMYRVVRESHAAALKKCKPGNKIKDLDIAARKVMKEAGMEEYFTHSLGHGVGLEIHESPRIKWDGPDKDLILTPGMVITIEPGLYKPGLGGVRYEDTVCVTKKGCENFF